MEIGEIGTIIHWQWAVICCSCFGKVWWFLKKLNIELPCDSAVSLLEDHLRGMETHGHLKIFT